MTATEIVVLVSIIVALWGALLYAILRGVRIMRRARTITADDQPARKRLLRRSVIVFGIPVLIVAVGVGFALRETLRETSDPVEYALGYDMGYNYFTDHDHVTDDVNTIQQFLMIDCGLSYEMLQQRDPGWLKENVLDGCRDGWEDWNAGEDPRWHAGNLPDYAADLRPVVDLPSVPAESSSPPEPTNAPDATEDAAPPTVETPGADCESIVAGVLVAFTYGELDYEDAMAPFTPEGQQTVAGLLEYASQEVAAGNMHPNEAPQVMGNISYQGVCL